MFWLLASPPLPPGLRLLSCSRVLWLGARSNYPLAGAGRNRRGGEDVFAAPGLEPSKAFTCRHVARFMPRAGDYSVFVSVAQPELAAGGAALRFTIALRGGRASFGLSPPLRLRPFLACLIGAGRRFPADGVSAVSTRQRNSFLIKKR